MSPESPDRPLRAALSACGGMATVTLEAARRSPDLEIVALQDPRAESRDRAGDAFGIERRHEAFEDLLTDDVDAVVLNGPNHVHRRQVELAAAAGKACLVQKPMASTVADAEAMVAAAMRHDVKLGVTMLALGDPLHHQVRAMVADGWLGEPTLVEAVAAHGIYLREPPPPDDWRRDPEKVGGGAFIQLAVHDIDLASWILGREVTAVAALGAGGRTVFEDETTAAAVRFGDDLAGTFTASYATDLYSFGICGTRGRILLLPDHVVVRGETAFRGDVFAYEDAGREVVLPRASMAEAVERRRDALEIHGAFARWVLGTADGYPCPGERGLRDLRVVDAVHRARREGRWVEVGRFGDTETDRPFSSG